jgi:hypothetical protein
MFVLKPGGKGKGSSPSQFQLAIRFFGKLGLYFGGIRLAYIFFSRRALKQQGAAASN